MPSQARQPTAGGRPPSGMRLGTRMGTAQRNGAGLQSVGLSTNVVVDNRPVTRQGLTGMHTKPLGPGRQIADDKFFITELRTRIADITNETTRMRQEQETIKKDNASYAQYERKYEEQIKHVKDLEGELADFNLALDKLRTNTSVDDIQDMHDRIKQRNSYEAQQVDEVFMKTQQQQKKTLAVEREIDQIHQTAANRISTLGEDAANEYRSLQDEQKSLQQDIDDKETTLQQYDAKITHLQQQLQSKEYQTHQKGLELKKTKQKLLSKRMELEEDTDASLTPEEMRDKLKQKVKDANSEIEASERRLKQLDQLVERYHDDIHAKEQELSEAKKHAQKAKKYEAVYERDRKMQEFIDEYDEVYHKEVENKKTLKNTIVALMKHISKQYTASENLPDAQQLTEMREELSFKEQKLKNSKNTLSLLNHDLDLRKQELDKINTLDKKINAELKAQKDKIQSMKVEMSQFKSDDELKHDATEAKKALQKEKQRTKKLKDSSKHQVQILGQAFDKRKKELTGNETMKRMDALEQKLRTYSSTVYSLQDFIDSRKRESDYEGIHNEVKELTKQINKHIIDTINARPK